MERKLKKRNLITIFPLSSRLCLDGLFGFSTARQHGLDLSPPSEEEPGADEHHDKVEDDETQGDSKVHPFLRVEDVETRRLWGALAHVASGLHGPRDGQRARRTHKFIASPILAEQTLAILHSNVAPRSLDKRSRILLA